LGAWLWGWVLLDPLIALPAAVLITRWAYGLLLTTGRVLLDAEGPAALRREATDRLEAITGGRVTDLHLWSVGQGGWTLVASAVNHAGVTPEACRAALHGLPGLYHPVIELHPCATCTRADDTG
jgi:Co/Zn/Cd efflux system component